MTNPEAREVIEAKEALEELLGHYQNNGLASRKFIYYKDALQLALSIMQEYEGLKEKLLKFEDDCIMCPHKKTLFEQDREIARLQSIVNLQKEALERITYSTNKGDRDIAKQALEQTGGELIYPEDFKCGGCGICEACLHYAKEQTGG